MMVEGLQSRKPARPMHILFHLFKIVGLILGLKV